MIGDSLTTDNLLDILKAMQKIKPIDQSQYFENYMGEIMQRLKENEKSKAWIESQLSKMAPRQRNQGTNKRIEHD
jgi:preprotein translocase subunit Sec63